MASYSFKASNFTATHIMHKDRILFVILNVKNKKTMFHWRPVMLAENTTVHHGSSQFLSLSAFLSYIRSFSDIQFSAYGQNPLCAFLAVFKLN